jgi:hypothetical protein
MQYVDGYIWIKDELWLRIRSARKNLKKTKVVMWTSGSLNLIEKSVRGTCHLI